MSVSTTSIGGGQSSVVVYGFDDGDEIREIHSDGHRKVVERDSTRSNLTDCLPELPIPGTGGIQQPDCGEDIPAFACGDCGNPVYVGRTCGSPRCSRCWESSVKSKVTRYAGKLEGFRRKLYGDYNGRKDIDFNHVVASLPGFIVDSTNPVERGMKVLKSILEENWYIEGFAAVYHPYRIKQEYRRDQYEHGGESGEGDMAWKDVLESEDPYQYLKKEPHFHLFFAAPRKSFDYTVAEAVEDDTGWLFHRITKSKDNNVSISDLDDLVHQLTYSLSHTGVNNWKADRDELTTRMKGDLHNCYVPDGVEEEVLASFCEAAPRLLGARFSNLSEATCSAEIPKDDTDDPPVTDVWEPEPGIGVSRPPSSRSESITGGGNDRETSSSASDGSSVASDGTTTGSSPIDLESVDGTCGGELRPMSGAKGLLDDPEWCDGAPYVDGLRRAVEEWEDLNEGDKPWSGSMEGDVIRGG